MAAEDHIVAEKEIVRQQATAHGNATDVQHMPCAPGDCWWDEDAPPPPPAFRGGPPPPFEEDYGDIDDGFPRRGSRPGPRSGPDYDRFDDFNQGEPDLDYGGGGPNYRTLRGRWRNLNNGGNWNGGGGAVYDNQGNVYNNNNGQPYNPNCPNGNCVYQQTPAPYQYTTQYPVIIIDNIDNGLDYGGGDDQDYGNDEFGNQFSPKHGGRGGRGSGSRGKRGRRGREGQMDRPIRGGGGDDREHDDEPRRGGHGRRRGSGDREERRGNRRGGGGGRRGRRGEGGRERRRGGDDD